MHSLELYGHWQSYPTTYIVDAQRHHYSHLLSDLRNFWHGLSFFTFGQKGTSKLLAKTDTTLRRTVLEKGKPTTLLPPNLLLLNEELWSAPPWRSISRCRWTTSWSSIIDDTFMPQHGKIIQLKLIVYKLTILKMATSKRLRCYFNLGHLLSKWAQKLGCFFSSP